MISDQSIYEVDDLDNTLMPSRDECKSDYRTAPPEFDLQSIMENAVEYPLRSYDRPEDAETIVDLQLKEELADNDDLSVAGTVTDSAPKIDFDDSVSTAGPSYQVNLACFNRQLLGAKTICSYK